MIIETTTERFEADVVQQSMERPVVVDFWSPGCEPCRQLTPMLEKIANEYGDRFALVKVNVDECPEIASSVGVSSIPLVMALSEGRPCAQPIQGLLPEPQLRQWFESFMPSPADEAFREGQELEASDPAGAEVKYRVAAEHDPERAEFQIALARVLIMLDREVECREIIERLEQRGFLEPEAEAIKGQLELFANAEESGGVQQARTASEANPDDLTLRVKLADALAADKKLDEACEVCLDVIGRDKYGVGNDAKESMVRILGMMGPKSERASQYRRQLATAFY